MPKRRKSQQSIRTEEYIRSGQKLRKLRNIHGLTVSELAKKLGVSYSLVSGMESGYKRISPRLFPQLTQIFRLSKLQAEALATSERWLPMPGNYLPAEVLLEMETEPEIGTACVIDPLPQEVFDADWLRKVCTDLGRREYVYFLPDEDIAYDLRSKLEKETSDVALIGKHVRFVVVPEPIAAFFFHPTTALWHSRKGDVKGAWAFRDDHGKVDGGILIDRTIAHTLGIRISRILHDLESQGEAPLSNDSGAMNFRLIPSRNAA